MRFYRNLYVSESLKGRKEVLVKKMKAGKYPLTAYILALIEDGENQMEFYSTALLRQKLISDEGIFVVGLAAGYEDAIYLVEEITREVYAETGSADIRSYIEQREREGGQS